MWGKLECVYVWNSEEFLEKANKNQPNLFFLPVKLLGRGTEMLSAVGKGHTHCLCSQMS